MKILEWIANSIGLSIVLFIAVCAFLLLIIKMTFFELIYLWIVLLFAHVIYEVYRW